MRCSMTSPTRIRMCTLRFGARAGDAGAGSPGRRARRPALSPISSIDDADLADQATAIAEIDVLSKSPAAGTALPSTEYVVLVERVLKGSLDATAVIRVLGGERRGRHEVRGARRARRSARARRRWSSSRPAATAPSPFSTSRSAPSIASTTERDEPRSRCAISARRSPSARRREPPADRERDYERFATWLADRARGARRGRGLHAAGDCPDRARDRRALPPVRRQRHSASAGSSSTAGARWDSDFNGAGSGNPARDRDAFLQALAAWNDDPGSNVNYAFLGDTVADNFPESDGGNGVVFGDPNDEIEGSFDCSTGGTLAIGGVLFDGSTGRFGGARWFRILEAGIVMQDGIDCALQGNAPLIAEILTHELGHTLGHRPLLR